MTYEEQIILCLIKESFTHIDLLKNIDFDSLSVDKLFSEARVQGIALLVYNCLNNHQQFKGDKLKAWKEYSYKAIANNVQVGQAQRKLCLLLSDYNYVIIKGTSSAEYYNKPLWRELGDVDFLIDPKDIQGIHDILVADGYVCVEDNHPCHRVYIKGNCRFEMHFSVAGIPYGEIGDKIQLYLKPTLLERKVAVYQGNEFPSPLQNFHALILLLHMHHHMFGEGIGLRHLLDWACFVESANQEHFWDDLCGFLEEIKMLTFAQAMTKTCALFFGIQCPKWATDIEDDLCEDVMKDILSLGNFGKKDEIRSKSGSIISEHGKDKTEQNLLFYWLSKFHRNTVIEFPIASKSLFLRIILEMWRFIRLPFRMLTGKSRIEMDLVSSAKERNRLYYALKVFDE